MQKNTETPKTVAEGYLVQTRPVRGIGIGIQIAIARQFFIAEADPTSRLNINKGNFYYATQPVGNTNSLGFVTLAFIKKGFSFDDLKRAGVSMYFMEQLTKNLDKAALLIDLEVESYISGAAYTFQNWDLYWCENQKGLRRFLNRLFTSRGMSQEEFRQFEASIKLDHQTILGSLNA